MGIDRYGLVAHYGKHTDIVSDTPYMLLDQSGNGNNATNYGATFVENGTAISFDSTTSIVKLNNSLPSITSSFTITGFVKSSVAQSGYPRIFGFDSVCMLYIPILDGKRIFKFVTNSGLYEVNDITDVADNVLRYITIRYNGTILSIYVDGILIRSFTVVLNLSSIGSTPTFAVSNTLGLTQSHKGSFKQIKIFNKALSEAEITTLYNGGTVTDGLVLDLPMNAQSSIGNSLLDLSGKGNHGTINGATPCPDHNGRANRGWELSLTKRIERTTAFDELSIANPFTVQIAIKSNLAAGNSYWVTNYISATDKFTIYQTGSSFRIGISDNVTSYRKSKTLTTAWTFLTITWDLTTLRVKENGTDEWGGADGVNYPAIYPFACYGDGSSDFLAIYNRVLLDSSVLKNFNYWRTH